jgi:2-methylcitrate dehydratase PrpD
VVGRVTNPVLPLAELAARTRYEDLPPRAIEAAKTFILDTIGVGAGGAAAPRVAELVDTAASWGAGEEATVWVDGRKLPAGAAAVVNAYQIHALEWDCVHEPAVVHPMATLLSAIVAAAERRGARGRPVSGRELLLATVLGVEVACTIGAASRSPMRFFRPATAGGFGVVAGAGRIAGLDAGALVEAFGILYGQTSGTLQAHLEGSMVLGLQVGFNARAGLNAIDLAAAGLTGPHDVLTGPYGFYRLFEPESDIATWWSELGKTWQITRLSHKPFPSGRLTHAAIDAVQRARRERAFAADEVESIDGWVTPLTFRLVGRPDIPNPAANYAKLCIPFVMATELAYGGVGPEAFAGARLTDPATHALAARIRVVQDDNPDVNALWPQRFAIRLKDGWAWDRVVDRAIGHPDNPIPRAAQLAKFRRSWALAPRPLADADAVVRAVDALDALADVRELTALLRGRG